MLKGDGERIPTPEKPSKVRESGDDRTPPPKSHPRGRVGRAQAATRRPSRP